MAIFKWGISLLKAKEKIRLLKESRSAEGCGTVKSPSRITGCPSSKNLKKDPASLPAFALVPYNLFSMKNPGNSIKYKSGHAPHLP